MEVTQAGKEEEKAVGTGEKGACSIQPASSAAQATMEALPHERSTLEGHCHLDTIL